jgi:hypothetical protein
MTPQRTGAGRLVPHALVRLKRPDDRLAVNEGDAHTLADRVWFFARECENVGQEGFDALLSALTPQTSPQRAAGPPIAVLTARTIAPTTSTQIH